MLSAHCQTPSQSPSDPAGCALAHETKAVVQNRKETASFNEALMDSHSLQPSVEMDCCYCAEVRLPLRRNQGDLHACRFLSQLTSRAG